MPRPKILFLFVCRLTGLFRLAQWLTRGRLKILCYHGFELDDETDFRPKLFIKGDQFERRMAAVRRYGLRVMPLDEAVDRLYAKTLPDNAITITIDDGFDSFYRVAVPCLQRHQFSATVYVTTYYVQNPNPIFRLVVQYMFWKSTKTTLVVDNVPWSLPQSIDLTVQEQVERLMWECINFGEREATEQKRCQMCEELGTMLGVPYSGIVLSRMLHLMSPDQLGSLAQMGIAVELHTHRHHFSCDDAAQAQREIADNRAALKQWIATEPTHFCYPSGLWDERQWAWLDAMQVKSATTCLPGLNSPATPRHALRRFLDGENIHQLEFEAALSGFSDLLRTLRRAT
jgi:peptidoglycan/xylan/chitin deacetylase (PgdA/CDA1 family)